MKWITAIFSLLLVTIIVMADTGAGKNFFQLMHRIPGGDKAGHLYLYFIYIPLSERLRELDEN